MLILAITLSMFSIFLYRNFSRSLYQETDSRLISKAEGVSDAIDTYWETEKIEAQEYGADKEVFTKINNINFLKIAQRWVEEKSTDPKLINISVQIFDTQGLQIASSKNISTGTVFPKEVLNNVLLGKNYFSNFYLEQAEKKPLLFRTFAMPVFENGKIAYVVQVGTPLSLISTSLKRLKIILLILVPLTVFLTSIIGAFLAKMTLSPVDYIIRTIHQITAENLKLRIRLPDTRDEIRRLAETFNDMLARLDNTFSSQKQFIQDVSHELKTPLTILKGELDVTLKKIRSQKEYESVLISSLEEIDKISRIVENLLTLARLDDKDIRLDIRPLDLNMLLATILNDIKILGEQKNINIDFIPRDNMKIEADKDQIRRALLNLLDNAVKYTPPNGSVGLQVIRDGNFAKIKINDTGGGIPESELPRIFDRFYRVDKSRSSDGFGLGLSIAKSIVEVHHGKIEVESKPGLGATFTVSLPLSIKD